MTETTTAPANTMTALAEQYIAAFNETDPVARRALSDETFSEDATYVDPLMTGDGQDGIDAMIGGVQAQFPGFTFRLTGKVDGFADRLRFSWELSPPEADEPLVAGTDFATLAADGRLTNVTGFLDLMPSAAE